MDHPLPKRSFSSFSNGAFASHKSVYDGVFGGAPPKLGLPALAPRLEDYSEIFGGFHAARSSSIPLLALPLIADDRFDVRSPGFNYADVFGDAGGLAFTALFEDLVPHSYASSDDSWSPERSGSISDELDPLAGSDKSCGLSDGDALKSIMQFNASYKKSSQRNVLTGISHITNFNSVPGYTVSHDGSPVSWNEENEHSSNRLTVDTNDTDDFVAEEKHYKKSPLNPLYSGFNTQNDYVLFEKHENFSSPRDKPFITVSDISLRTKPSQLPPPSRPPPALAVKKGESDGSNPKLKAYRSYAFERVVDDNASLFYDVEVDATISAAGGENGNTNVQVKHESTGESIGRKEIQSHGAMQVEEKTNKTIRETSGIEDERMLQSRGKETTVPVPVIEDGIRSSYSTEESSRSNGLQYCDLRVDNSAGDAAWREATDYFEVIEIDTSRQAFDMVVDFNTSMQFTNRDARKHHRTTYSDIFNPKEDIKKSEVTKEADRWHGERNRPETAGEHCERGNRQEKKMPDTRLSDQQVLGEKIIPSKLVCAYDSDKMVIPENFQQLGESEKPQIDHSEYVEGCTDGKGSASEVETKLKPSVKRLDLGKRSADAQVMKPNIEEPKPNIVIEKSQRRLEDVNGVGTTQTREKVNVVAASEGIEKQHGGISGEEKENRQKETHKLNETRMIPEVAKKDGKSDKKSYIAAEHEKSGSEQPACGVERDKERLPEAGKRKKNELTFREALEHVEDDKDHKLVREWEVTEERNREASNTEDYDSIFTMAEAKAGNKEEVCETKISMNVSRDAIVQKELGGHTEEIAATERHGHEGEEKWDLDNDAHIQGGELNAFEGGCKLDKEIATKFTGKQDKIQAKESTQAAVSSDGNGELKTEPISSTCESVGGMGDTTVKRKSNRVSMNEDESQGGNTRCVIKNNVESPILYKQTKDSNSCGSDMGVSCVIPEKNSNESVKIKAKEDSGFQNIKTPSVSKGVDIKDRLNTSQVIRESLLNERKGEDVSSVLKHSGDTLYAKETVASQRIERKDKNMKDGFAAKDQTAREGIRRETELEDENMRKMEEEREREREREKDRMAVDKAALEAHERSYVEARERAAVRQRAMVGARERLEKASMEARQRGFVERATAEARQRAAEKTLAQRAAYDAYNRVERSVPDRFSDSSRYADTRQSSSSTDRHFQSTGISNDLRYSYTSAHVGAEGESPRRCKARLERYRRTAERAANALAEKNRRDLLTQREREERNRVAEALDGEVKRWSSGKEGNLRALLSTLQYILGPDSGWQPVPLTEVISSAAVKKAYRKATLCVHPDKLQQRGATVQQKYICEKVFDLLKEAWNKFNSEER